MAVPLREMCGFLALWDNFRRLDFFDAASYVLYLNGGALFRIFGILSWSVWQDRNNWVFEKVCKIPEKILVEALGFLEAFDHVHVSEISTAPHRDQVWIAPLPGWVKVNCDASLSEDVPGLGIGCCFRGHDGTLLAARSCFKAGAFSVPVAETVAILEGLSLAMGVSGAKIVVEGDCKGVIDLINSGEFCLNEFGLVLSDISSLAFNLDVVFSFVPRICNRVAHGLARHAFVNSISES